MAQKCYVCGKGPSVGHSVSRSGNKTERRWMPNLQKKRIKIKGSSVKKTYVCTSCLKSGKVEVVY